MSTPTRFNGSEPPLALRLAVARKALNRTLRTLPGGEHRPSRKKQRQQAQKRLRCELDGSAE